MGCADAPPHRAPRVHGNPPPGAPPPGVGRPHRRLPRPRDSPRRHVAGGPAEDARQGLPAPRPRPPAGDPGPPPTEVGRPLAPPSRPLVAALPPPTHLPALRGMRHGVLRSVDRRQQVRAVRPGGRVPLARTSRRPAQAHRGGGPAPAHRGGTRPLTRARGPRGRCPICGSTCTCGTPHPLRTCRTCSRPDPHPPPPSAEPAVPCHADGGMGQDTPGPAAKCRRRPSGAWWRTRWRRHTRRTLPRGVTWRAVRGLSSTRPPSPRLERSGGPYAAPGDAPDREHCPAGAHRPSTGTGWSGTSPTGRAGPCPWGTPCS